MTQDGMTIIVSPVQPKTYNIRIKFIGRDRRQDFIVGDSFRVSDTDAAIKRGNFLTLNNGKYDYTINPAAIETYRFVEATKVAERYR